MPDRADSPLPAALCAALADRGPALAAEALAGSIPLGESEARPWLVLTEAPQRPLLLLAAATERDHFTSPVLEAHPLAYRPGLLGDQLAIGGYTLGVPAGRSEAVRALFARARLGEPPAAWPAPRGSALVDALLPRERAWLAGALRPGEVLLAWLRTETEASLDEPVLDGARPPWRLLLTDRRLALVASSELGDLGYRQLSSPLTISPRVGRGEHIASGALRWSGERGRGAAWAVAAAASAAPEGAPRRRLVARALLGGRPGPLPDEQLSDLLPPEGADLTEGDGGQRLRSWAHELLLESCTEAERPEIALALAQLQPLVPERIAQLAALWPDPRAAQVAAVLAPGGLAPERQPPLEPIAIRALPAALIEQKLRHPAARRGGALARLQTLLASAEVPESGELAAWCERLTGEGEAQAALTDAALALGVAGVDGFISRGERSLGLRAYEGDPPFLLLGGQHLSPGGPAALSPAELRSVIGAELAHLRFQHARVTAGEVWNGAWEMGLAGLDFMLTALPAIKGWKLAESLGAVASRYAQRVGLTGELWRRVGRAPAGGEGRGPAGGAGLSRESRELIAAHRVMQLTADRAGLVLCGQLQAAIRGMFMVYPSYRAELPLAVRHGLPAALGRRAPSGALRYQDLSIRIAALIAFYLSEDYPALRRALTG